MLSCQVLLYRVRLCVTLAFLLRLNFNTNKIGKWNKDRAKSGQNHGRINLDRKKYPSSLLVAGCVTTDKIILNFEIYNRKKFDASRSVAGKRLTK